VGDRRVGDRPISPRVALVRSALWETLDGRNRADERTERDRMMSASPLYLFSVDFITAFFLAYGLAMILKWRGPVGPLEGAWIGFAFGLLIFGTMTWLDYAYSGWGITLGFINVGYVAVGMAIQGAILAAWKPKAT
jgi:hypothetical protein